MSEKEQEKIDSLFAGYLDGELNERERTELKRMLLTYPARGAELKALRRQKDLLAALPVEKAPANLSADVRAALERSMILNPEGGRESDSKDEFWLFARRIAAAAAMLLLPVGLLGLIVFEIMKPVETNPAGPGFAQETVGNPNGSSMADGASSDDILSADAGRLVLYTDQPILVNRFIEKRIHLHSLLNQTMPVRESGKTVYEIQCPSPRLVRFMEDLGGVWPRCSDARYTLSGEGIEDSIVVNRIGPDQITILMGEVNADSKRRSAGYFARLNQQTEGFHPNPTTVAEEITPPQPVIAWDTISAEGAEATAEEGPSVLFTLEVHSSIPQAD